MGKDDAGYYGILPSEVRYDKTLLPSAKLLYVEITSLCRKEGYCWATNGYFAELFDTTERTIKRWIKILCDKEYCFSEVKTFRYEDGTIRKIRYICLTKRALKKLDSIKLDHTDKCCHNHSDIECQNHGEIDVTYNNKNNELGKNIGTKVPMAKSPNNEVVRSQRSLEIDQAFVMWEEIMGYPLQENKTDRRSVQSILSRKGMDLDKLRVMLKLVEASQHDKYKRFSVSSFTDLMYKTNELRAWAKEKYAQNQSNATTMEV